MEEEKIIKLLDDESTRREAFGQIVNQYSETLYWKIRHIVVGHDDANDVWITSEDSQNFLHGFTALLLMRVLTISDVRRNVRERRMN